MRATLRFTTTVLVLVCFAQVALGENQMPWQPNLESAQRLAAKTNRLVLIHFWAPWCRPCMRLENEVFSKPETAKGLEANFVLVKLNADDAPGTARMYGVSSLPSDVITQANGKLVSQIQSPPSVTQYVQQMNQAAAGHRSLARKVGDAGIPEDAASEAANPAGNVAPQEAYPAPPATNVAAMPVAAPGGPQPPAADPYAEYAPPEQPAIPAAEATASQVTPAQAYAPVGAPQGAPLVDPYAQPASAPANPYAAPPASTPAQAPSQPMNPYATPQADPYAAAPPAAAPPTAAPPTAAPPANPYAAAPQPQAPGANPYAAQPAAANPYAPQQPPANPYTQQPPAANPYAPAAAVAAMAPPQVGLPQLPPGCPPLALEGNCAVTLLERKRWAVGHPTFGAVHRGSTYLFLGPQERDKFLADPDRYSPVLSGLDPVLALDSHQSVPGKREFGVFGADGKIYLFADEKTRAQFEQNEPHYTAAAQQAMQQPTYQAMRQGP